MAGYPFLKTLRVRATASNLAKYTEFKLTDLVDKDIQHNHPEYLDRSAAHYKWENFIDALESKLRWYRIGSKTRFIVLITQPGKFTVKIKDEDDFEDFLDDIADGILTTRDDLPLLWYIQKHESRRTWHSLDTLLGIPWADYRETEPEDESLADDEALSRYEIYLPEDPIEHPVVIYSHLQGQILNIDRAEEDFDIPEADRPMPPSRIPRSVIPYPPTPSPPHSLYDELLEDYEDTDDDQTLPFSEPSEFEPSDADVSDLEQTLDLENLDIGEFKTEEAQDDDYGALDLDVVDIYVGSYNAGDNDEAWRSCLQFFNINPDEYYRQAAVRPSAGQARRVPMKKLPGMSIGLFDYQLIAVLNLFKFTLDGVAGGLLCDEQGLGKTQEMFGVIALAYNLHRSKAEVLEAYKKNDYRQHNSPNNGAVSCRADDRYGIQCYCHSQLTKQLADRLPDGLNLVVAPARTCTQFLREAKTKLDTKVFKLKSAHSSAEKDNKLTPANISLLRATVTATSPAQQSEAEQPVKYHYQVKSNQHNYILFVPSETLKSLMYVDFSVDVKLPKADGGKLVKMSGLLPGLVMLDEFHEYTGPSAPQNTNNLIPWLKHLKACSEASQRASPLVYFASGTPVGESPVDIRDAIDLFGLDSWTVNDCQPLAFFDTLTETFYTLTDQQAAGETVPREDIIRYRRDLDAILSKLMVRRLGTDTFRGRPLTALGPLKVSIVDHQLPAPLIPYLQALADRIRKALPSSAPIANVLHSTEQGQALLLRLRLASTFPGIALAPNVFTFTDDELTTFLSDANDNPAQTPYQAHIPAWSAGSPKLATIVTSITAMLYDTTPVPGEASNAKKLLLFSPLEAESLLLHLYLLTQQKAHTRLKPVYIHSGMSPSARQAVIDKFLQSGNAPPNVLVAPTALAGTGLNLHKAKYAIVTSPAWTRRENQQAYFRIHRVGQRQETKLQLLTCRWNPAERVILGRYEGRGVGDDEEMWAVDNRFIGEGGNGVVDRHNLVEE